MPVNVVRTEADAGAMRDYVALARSLAPLIDREAKGAEQRGHLTPVVIDAFKESELLWFLVPQELGGGAASIRSCIEVIEELGRSDGSTGWSFMAASIQTVFAAGWAGDAAIDAMFGGGRRAIVAGMPGPIGRAVQLPNGDYQGSGHFGFASGSGYANWFAAGMVVDESRRNIRGEPGYVTFFLPRDKITYVNNWDVLGLSGTGSNDFLVEDVTVSPEFAPDVRTHTPARGPARYRMGGLAIGAAGHCGVVLGMMKRALEEIAVIASTKSRLGYNGPIGNYPTFQQEFALQEALYSAVRARVLEIFDELEACAEAGLVPTPLQWGRMYQTTSWLHRVGPEVIRTCHAWSGSAGIRNPSVLARCLKDVVTAATHAVADPIRLVHAAPHLLELYAQNAQDRAYGAGN